MDHRKNVPTRKAHVPSSWFIVLTIMLCLGGAGWLGALLIGDSDSSPDQPVATKPSISMSPEPTKKTKEPKPSATTPKPSATPTTSTVERDVPVSVLNNSSIVGAAKAFSAKVASAGWEVVGIGNWTGLIDGNTVYYPPEFKAQAELLAEDVGIKRVRPSVAPMKTDRLTVILSPQS